MKTDINRFDGKYLKCIVTKYKSAINDNGYLANSGALIVYHPSTVNDEEINYVYLGNEFLASGYGFKSEETLHEAERIVDGYDNTIKGLQTAIAEEKAIRGYQDTFLYNEIAKYVKTDRGDISNTVVNINNKTINTKDILLYGEEAQYDNLEITNIEVKINDNDYTNLSNIYLPLGSVIKSINVKIEYNINDSGGIEKIEVVHNNINLGSNNEEESIIIKYDEDDNGVNYNGPESGVIEYKKIFSGENKIYITDVIENIISEFYIYVAKTPISKYKNYPQLEEQLGIEIKSTGNSIKPNIIQILKNINIIPYYSLLYQFSTDAELNSISQYEFEGLKDPYNKSMYISLNNINDEIIIPCQVSNNYKALFIALPNIYKIDKLYGVIKNETYNWTGAITVKDDDINFITYKNNYTNEEEKLYVTNCKLYKIYDTNNFSCDNINIKVSLIENINYEVDELNSLEGREEPISFDNNNDNLNDEEFNALYWVKLKNNETVENIDHILSPIIYNGSSNSN